MTNLTIFLSDLRTTAWRAGGARFNAARRLKRRDWFSALSIGLFSALGIGLTFVQKVYEVTAGTPADKYLTALSLCLGLFVIVISLSEWGANGAVKAESLFQNAQKLNAFQRKLAQILAEVNDGRDLLADEVTKLSSEYEQIKIECPNNHEPIDDKLFLADRRNDPDFTKLFGQNKPGWYAAKVIFCQSILSIVWYFGLFWFAIACFIVVTPWNGS